MNRCSQKWWKTGSCLVAIVATFGVAAAQEVPGRWSTIDTTDKIDWPSNWPGVRNLRAQWWKILAESPQAWREAGYLNHAKGEPPGNTYYLWRYDQPLPEGTKLLLEGDFPHARMFDIQVCAPWQKDMPYIGDGTGIQEVPLLDVDIEPDPGHTNPFRPGADRTAGKRHYHATFLLQDGNPVKLNPKATTPPYRAPGNSRVGCTRSGKDGKHGPRLWIRVYLPDGYAPYGGVEPPVIRIQRPGEEPMLAPITREVEFNIEKTEGESYSPEENPARSDGYSVKERESREWLRQWAQDGLAKSGRPGDIDAEVRRFFTSSDGRLHLIKLYDPAYFIGWLRHIGEQGHCEKKLPQAYRWLYGKDHDGAPPANDEHTSGQNVYNTYLTGAASIKPNEFLVFHGKAPRTPRTLNGAARMPEDHDLRYWNIGLGAGHPYRLTPVVDISDEEVILDDQGYYTIAIGRAQDRPANADAAHGITWRDWPVGNALSVLVRMMSTKQTPWEHAPQRISWAETDYCDSAKWASAVPRRMGPYAPEGRYLTATQLSALASGQRWEKTVSGSIAPVTTAPEATQIPDAIGSHAGSIVVDDLRRTFLLHRPANVEQGKALEPLVIVLHGGRMNGGQMEAFTGLSDLANEQGFLVVYPDGTGEYQGTEGWFNDGRLQAPDDVRFLTALIDALVAKAGADPRRVYLTGYSNGAGMANLAALRMTDRIAAVAPVAGTIAPILAQQYPPSGPLPVMYFHGTDDPFAYYGGGSKGTRRGSAYSAEDYVRFWATINGCDMGPAIAKLSQPADDKTSVERIEYRQCKAHSAVVFYKINGGGHTWPGNLALRNPRYDRLGATTAAVDANRAMWKFFSEHAKNP